MPRVVEGAAAETTFPADRGHRGGAPADSRTPGWSATQIALGYVVLAFVWIFFSDAALRMVVGDPESLSSLQTAKGWAFVAFTGLLLYFVLRREFSRQRVAADDLRAARDRAIGAERARKKSERTLFTLMSNLPGMAYRCRNDPDWTMEFVSQGCLDLTGYRPHDLVDNRKLSSAELIQPEDRERVWEEVQAAIRYRRPFQLLYRIRRADEAERWVWEQGRDVTSAEGDASFIEGFVTDVTERQKAIEEVERARDAALESSRLKEAFLANINHEIRTPLNVVLGYASLIAEKSVEVGEENPEEAVKAMDRSARRLLRTLHHVLDYSKIQSGQFEVHPADLRLAGEIAPLIDEYRSIAEEKGLAFSFENGSRDALVRMDPGCLEGAVANLLDNAVKFTERGGVAVRVYEADGGAHHLEVRDTGVGIAKEFLERCFEPFTQEDDSYKRRFEGLGIGLPLTKRYLDLNGVSLLVESEKGRGSVFTVCFPRK